MNWMRAVGILLLSVGIVLGQYGVGLYRSVFVPPGFVAPTTDRGFIAERLGGISSTREAYPLSLETYRALTDKLAPIARLSAAVALEAQVVFESGRRGVGELLATSDFLTDVKLVDLALPPGPADATDCLVSDSAQREDTRLGALVSLGSRSCRIVGRVDPKVLAFWNLNVAVISITDGSSLEARLKGRESNSIVRTLFQLRAGAQREELQRAAKEVRKGLIILSPEEYLFPRNVRSGVLAAGAVCLAGFILIGFAAVSLGVLAAAGRAQQIAVHAALGASPFSFFRHCLGREIRLHLPLAAVAAAANLVLASALFEGKGIDARSAVWSVGIAAAAWFFQSLVFCFPQTWHLRRCARREAGSLGRFRPVPMWTASAVQVAATILMVVSLTYYNSLATVASNSLGMSLGDLWTLQFVSPSLEAPVDIARAARNLMDSAPSVIGIQSVGVTLSNPVTDSGFRSSFSILGVGDFHNWVEGDGKPIAPGRKVVSPGYVTAVGARLVAGRDFSTADSNGAPRTALVNQAAVAAYWSGKNPIGSQVKPTFGADKAQEWATVVGVISDIQHEGYRGRIKAELYLSVLNERYPSDTLYAVVRASKWSGSLDDLQRTIGPLAGQLSLRQASSLHEDARQSIATIEDVARATLMAAAVGFIAQSLSVVFVAIWYARTRRLEVAVRRALGAPPSDILTVLVRRYARWAGAAALLGGVVAYWCTEYLASTDPLVGKLSPVYVTAVAGTLLLIAVVTAIGSIWKWMRFPLTVLLRH